MTRPRAVVEVRLRRARAAVETAGAVVAAHPRHALLFALVAGLLLGPQSAAATCAAAAVAALALAPRPGLALAGAAAVLAGAVVADARLASLERGGLARLGTAEVTATVVLLEPVRERAAGPAVARARLRDTAASGAQAVLRLPAGAHPGPWPRVGSILLVRGRVSPLGRYDAYQARRGAQAALTVRSLRVEGVRGGLAGRLDAVRARAERGLEAGLAPERAALLQGMVLGQDDRLGEAVRDDFERSGLAHLLAVSGQNVMLLATLVLAAGATVGLALRARLLVALALVALYVPLTGAGPSIQRAGVMGAAGLVAALAGRPASRWYALGLAAAVTLILTPRASGEPGWQLSFAAVVGLLSLAPPLRAALTRGGCPGALADVLAITLAATLATGPLLALHFERVSLASLPANLLAAPAVAPLMWLGMLAGAVAQVSPALSEPLNRLNSAFLGYVTEVAEVAGGLPGAAVPARLASPLALVGAYAALGGLVMAVRAVWRRRPPEGLRASAHGPRIVLASGLVVAALVAGALLWPRARVAMPGRGELVVSFLDVGQGDATLLQGDGAAVLFDTGPPDGPILRRLAEAGVGRLDALVLTHAQADHEGAALKVLRAHPPRLLVNAGTGWPTEVQRRLPAALSRARAQHVDAHAGQVLSVGRMRIRVLWPPRPASAFVPDGDPNDRALVAHVQVGDFDLLLPADAESNVTQALTLPRVEALKVAHHGSADAGLPALLARVKPAVAAIEVGRRNPYGHPAPSTLGALRAVPTLARTDRDGTVRLHVRGDAMRLERTGVRR